MTLIINSQHPLLVLSAEFTVLCKPLQQFHIHHVTYQKQYRDGRHISLSNRPQWIADYYNLNLYESSLFEAPPTNYQAGFDVWYGEYDLDVYQHGKQYYESTHSITITHPVVDGCEFYIFATSAPHYQAIHYLANNRDILYHFILFLKDRGADLFKLAGNYPIIIPKYREKKPSSSRLIADTNYHHTMKHVKEQFFKQTPVHSFVFEQDSLSGIKLSPRETQCLIYLLQQKTAPEIAQLTNLSRRTVESYLDHIKIKLNCQTKAELLDKLKNERFLMSLR